MSTTTPSISHHKIRARPSAGPLQGASPHTPLSRSVSGLYGSPGSSFRIDDENLLIFEIGSRCMRAGFAGESAPRCKIDYGPEMWRRVGDYRQWSPEYTRKVKSGKRWAEGYELWEGLDVRELDLGLVEDRVEKIIREAESKFLLLDNRAKRIALAAPSDLPRPLLSLMLGRLFETLQAASITILPSSIMACVGAGVRSALVVDLGWFETSVNAVFEYREVRQARTLRAGKLMARKMKKVLRKELEKMGSNEAARLGFDQVEEVLCRMAWCRSKDTNDDASKTITLPGISKATEAPLEMPFEALSGPTETVFFATDTADHSPDDHDLPIPQLIYTTLLHLPVDIRNSCMSSVIFTGGLSNIPGLKPRILAEVQSLVSTNGWDPIRAYAPRLGLSRPAPRTAIPLTEISPNILPQPTGKRTESTLRPPSSDEPPLPPAHARPHDTNPIDAKLASLSLSTASPTPTPGTLRAVNTLGAWAGASLMMNLRVKGVVEIERERFLSHGLVGGAVPGSVKPGVLPLMEGGRNRQSLGPGVKLGEKSGGWSLGVWA